MKIRVGNKLNNTGIVCVTTHYREGGVNMWYDNQFTEALNIQYPIIQAGMAGSTTPELVASVSNKGGLGCIGAGYFTTEKLEQEIEQVRTLTTQPFGVNLFVPGQHTYTNEQVERMNAWLKPYRKALNLEEPVINISEAQQFNQAIHMIIKKKIPVCCFTFGIPSQDIIKQLTDAQVTLIGTATSVDEAIENEQAGMDIVVAQGSEAGGHRGSFLPSKQQSTPLIGTMSLIPQIVDQVTIPVVAAGGIMDGRGVLASQILGAQGVQMGTAFLTTVESGANDLVKQAVLHSKETDTIVTDVFSGKFARGIHNEFVEKLSQYVGVLPPYPVQNQLTNAIRKTAASNGKREWTHMWSGQSPRLATAQHVDQVMDKLVEQIEALLKAVQ